MVTLYTNGKFEDYYNGQLMTLLGRFHCIFYYGILYPVLVYFSVTVIILSHSPNVHPI